MLDKFEPKLRVLGKIYEYCEVKKEPIWWTKLLQILESEEISRHEIFKATEELDVRCRIIYTRYQMADKMWTACYQIYPEMKEMAKAVYEKIEGIQKKTSDEAFKEFYGKLMFIYPNGSADDDLPECDNRILGLGSNVCLGNEPYSCERMFKDFKCPRGYIRKKTHENDMSRV